MWCSSVPVLKGIWFSRALDKTHFIFWKSWSNSIMLLKKKREQSEKKAVFNTIYSQAVNRACIGQIYTLVLPFTSEENRGRIDRGLEFWNNYCVGKINAIYERYKFNNSTRTRRDNWRLRVCSPKISWNLPLCNPRSRKWFELESHVVFWRMGSG